MPLTKFTIPPDQNGYSVVDGAEVLSVQLDGGAGRYRQDVLNSASRVSVQWTLNSEEFQYFRAFYRTITKSGSLPFLIDLIIDSQELTEHEVYFVAGSVRLPSLVATENFTVSAQLEVKPITADAAYDEAIVMLFNEYGSLTAAKAVLDQLEQLANVDMPGSLPG